METAEIAAPVVRERRHDLDWVRVLASWLLILFHVAIAFVPWDVYAYVWRLRRQASIPS